MSTNIQSPEDGIPPAGPTLRQLRNQFLDWSKSRGLSPVTEDTYRRDFDRVLRNSTLADMPIQCIDGLAIRDFVAWGLHHFSEPTVAQCLFMLKRILHFAAKLGLVNRVPEVRLGRLKRSRKMQPPASLSVDEFRAVIKEVKDEPFRTMLIVAGCLGLRANEVSGLKWEDLSDHFSKLTIKRSFGSGFVTRVKNSCHASLVVSPEMATILKSWRATTEFNKDSDWVFANPRRQGTVPYDAKDVMQLRIAPAAVRAGIQKPVNCTVLRFSCAAMFLDVGVDIFTISRLMRHRSVLTTERYLSCLPGRVRDANASFDQRYSRRPRKGVGTKKSADF